MGLPKFVVLTCGVAASGKSTFCVHLSQLANAEIFSKDAIYKELNIESMPAPEHFRDVAESLLLSRCIHHLGKYDSIIVDTAILERSRRKNFLDSLSIEGVQLFLILFADPGKDLAQKRLKKKKKLYDKTCDAMYLGCTPSAYSFSSSKFQVIDLEEEAYVLSKCIFVKISNILEVTVVNKDKLQNCGGDRIINMIQSAIHNAKTIHNQSGLDL